MDIILKTDMKHHFKMVSDMGPLFERHFDRRRRRAPSLGSNCSIESNGSPSGGSSSSVQYQQDTAAILSCIVHAADISNVVKPWSVSRKWCALINQEFVSQVSVI